MVVTSPPLRRMKTYTAESGYVYQYVYVGKREALREAPESPATEFIFDVTRDRKTIFAISVFLGVAAVEAWAAAHGRKLTEPEQYAAAKMRLQRGFDEIGSVDLRQHPRHLSISSEQLEELLGELGLD
jgi:hypothetical protein